MSKPSLRELGKSASRSVQDKALVRMLAVNVLEEAGFRGDRSPERRLAVQVLEQREDIRVVFTNVDMPGRLNGFQRARHRGMNRSEHSHASDPFVQISQDPP